MDELGYVNSVRINRGAGNIMRVKGTSDFVKYVCKG